MEKETGPSPMDVHVGARIRLRRTLMGMSQEKLGDALNITFQQVQKYERGVNRVGASRLFDVSKALDVPISFFYDDMPETLAATHGQQLGRFVPKPPGFPRRRRRSARNSSTSARRWSWSGRITASPTSRCESGCSS